MFSRTDPPEPSSEQRDWSIADPQLVNLFTGGPALSGVTVSENSVMGLPSVIAAVGTISNVVAGLPLRTLRTKPDGSSERVSSFLDDYPAGPFGPTPFEFVHGIMVSLLLRGNWFALKVFGGAGQLLWLQPIPSHAVGIEVDNNRKVYRVQLDGGNTRTLTDREILHIPGESLDGTRGVSPITLARNSFGTSIAGEQSAARLYKNGALMSGIVTPAADVELSPEEATAVRDALDHIVGGVANAGSIAVLSKSLNMSQWSVSPADAQWLESRRFQVAEVARIFRVPPHLVGDVERSTSWGEGIAEQSLGFQKYTLQGWTQRIQDRLTRLLNEPEKTSRKAEFDYRQLLAGSPKDEIELLMAQTGGQPILSVNEARAIQNRAPIEGGEVLLPPKPTTPQEIPA